MTGKSERVNRSKGGFDNGWDKDVYKTQKEGRRGSQSKEEWSEGGERRKEWRKTMTVVLARHEIKESPGVGTGYFGTCNRHSVSREDTAHRTPSGGGGARRIDLQGSGSTELSKFVFRG